MPWYTKKALSDVVLRDPEGDVWDPLAFDIAYQMAEDELAFDPKYVNRLNILKGAASLSLNPDERVTALGDSLLSVYLGGDVDRGNLLEMINDLEEEYDIYTDEGSEFVERLVNSKFLEKKKLQELYWDKYQDEPKYQELWDTRREKQMEDSLKTSAEMEKLNLEIYNDYLEKHGTK